MAIPQEKRTVRYVRYAIIVLVVVLFILLFFFVQNYRSLRREQIVSAHEAWLTLVLKNHGPLPAADASTIRPWMTFDYIDRLFNVPPEYLKSQLGVTDPRYPKLSLSGYAKSGRLSLATVVGEVQGALHDYLTNGSSTSASSTMP